MLRARTIAIALSAAVLSLPAAAFGQGASGAGDDQYADPFDNGGGSTPSQTTTGSQTSSGSTGLSQDPNLGGSSAPSAPSGAAAATTASGATGTAPGTLPNTGSDPRLLILAGLALLLSGLGLRLRTADEIF